MAAEQPPPSERAPRKSDWRAVVPVPAHAPPAVFEHRYRGPSEATYEYRFEGELLGYVCRFTTSQGERQFIPLTWCVDRRDDRGLSRWHWKLWEDPRPLYVPAGSLSEDLAHPVLLVEDEEQADAAHEALGQHFDVVSWPGGRSAWAKCLWSWLQRRTVYLWPAFTRDRERLSAREAEAGVIAEAKPLLPMARQPGARLARDMATLLHADQLCKVFVVGVPEPGAAEAFSVAIALQAVGADQVRELIGTAQPFVPADPQARAKGELTPGMAGADQEAGESEWRRKLLRSATTDAPQAVRENVVLALDGLPTIGLRGVPALDGVVAFNEFTHDVVKLKPAPWGSPAGVWEEVDELLLGEWLVREHRLPPMKRTALEEAVRMVAFRHRFHPVRSYLDGLRWDGEPRLRLWLRRVTREDDEEAPELERYLARVGTWFLQAMVARVMRPGCKFDYMLILEGPQGWGKSSVLRALAGEWFTDTTIVLGDKDSYQQLQGRWMLEFSELDAWAKADVTRIKGFTASTSDYFRGSYDKRAKDHPRQIVFAGTTNEDHYLTDPTGNRRSWPVKVTRRCDVAWLLEHRDQLFAEAVQRWREGARMHPSADEERDLFVPQQRERTVESTIESAVYRYLYDQERGADVHRTTLVELLQKIGIGVEKLTPGRFHEKQAAAALRRLGWTEKRASGPGRPRVYERPPERAESADAGATTRADDDCPF